VTGVQTCALPISGNNLASLFPSAQVTSLVFQGGIGARGDQFYNLTSLPSVQNAGANAGVNYLQGGTGNDRLVGDPNPAGQTYETDSAGTNVMVGGTGLNNFFAGRGSYTFTTGPGFNALYSILATSNVINASAGTGYIIVNPGSKITSNPSYSIVTFFQFGAVGAATPNTPAALVQPDANGHRILYLNPQMASTSYAVYDFGGTIYVLYNDAAGFQLFAFPDAGVTWMAEFGAGGQNTVVNNTSINDVLYGGLSGNHYLVGGYGINVLKGHTGQNVLVARGAIYNDVTAGNGTDLIVTNPYADGVVRANQKSVSTTILGLSRETLLVGVPAISVVPTLYDPFDSDTVVDDQDYAFWAPFALNVQP